MVMRTFSITLAVLITVGGANLVNGQTTIMVERLQDLDLTDQQEAKIAEIQKASRPKVEEAAKTVRDLVKQEVDKIREVLTAEQKQKAQSLKDERAERREERQENLAHTLANLKEVELTDAEMTKIEGIREEFRPQLAKALKELDGLLTDAQKKARQDALDSGKRRKEVLQAINLTDAQRDKVASVAKDLRGIVGDELEQVRDVFTAQQAEKVQQAREERKEQVRDRMAYRIANARELNLTEEQKTKIADIRQEYRPRIHEAGNKLRAAGRDEVQQIVAVIKG
jgi:Spy/CpxP family protein refolding chaperone